VDYSEWIRKTYHVVDPPLTYDGMVWCFSRVTPGKMLAAWREGGYPPDWMHDRYLKEKNGL